MGFARILWPSCENKYSAVVYTSTMDVKKDSKKELEAFACTFREHPTVNMCFE